MALNNGFQLSQLFPLLEIDKKIDKVSMNISHADISDSSNGDN